MKKLFKQSLAVLLSATLLLTAVPFAASAAEVAPQEQSVGAKSGTTGDCTWTLDDNGTLTISGNGKMGDYDIKNFDGTYITDAPWGAYIKTVVIKDGVTSIGGYAFRGCTGLTSVTIGNGVTSIGGYAFRGCTGLTSVTVGSGNSVYDSRNNCNAIIKTATNELVFGCKTTIIPDSVTSIGYYAFYKCTGLTSVTIPDSVTSIREEAFYGCTGLTSVTIGNSVTSIGGRAFMDCTGLTSVSIPDSVTSIGDNAFLGTTWYNNQPDGMIYAGRVAYQYKGTMPDNTSIIIRDGTKGIAFAAFRGRTGLTSVTIPDSLANIEGYSFNNTAWYNNQPDGMVYAGRVAYKYKGTMPDNTSIIIRDGTKGIAGDAFEGCTGLTSVSIPDSVTSIGDYAFKGCTGLTSVSIPDSVTSIGWSAFFGCTGLTSVSIPDSVTTIGAYAFERCTGLTSVSIPDSVTTIETEAFSDCTGLTSVTIPDSVTRIGDKAFYGCTGLTSVIIPDSVTSIEEYSLGYKWYLKKIDGLTIYGVPGSAAEQYANDNGFTFIEWEDAMIGDVTGDGRISIRDVTAIQRHLANINTLSGKQLRAADVDGNGKVDINDATHLQRYLAEFDVTIG